MQRGFEHMNGNACLVNGYCHLVNKTLFFIQKYFEGIIPAGRPDQEIYWKTKAVYEQIRELLDGGREEEVGQILQGYLEFATAYFEQGEPWKTREKDRRACRNTILNSVQMIANLTVWLGALEDCPAYKVEKWLNLGKEWQVHSVRSGYELPKTEELTLTDVKKAFQTA